ncbi:MAG TPA: hypothetical protein VF018_06185, partial [Acidobacteriaceae bacterium]
MIQRVCVLLFCVIGVACIGGSVASAGGDSTVNCADERVGCYEAGYAGLTEQQREGRDTWYFWTGGDSDAEGHVVGDQA